MQPYSVPFEVVPAAAFPEIVEACRVASRFGGDTLSLFRIAGRNLIALQLRRR